MSIKARYLEPAIAQVPGSKMLFFGAPRQVGKTTLALPLVGPGADERHPAYFNWDDSRSAARLRRGELPPDQPTLVFDEIHKYARWRNLVKGIYDTERSRRRVIVTGSARLDYYRKGGDSVANRCRYFRLHPFSLPEVARAPTRADVDVLLRFGGFPEPWLAQDERALRIWERDRISRVVREDLHDLEHVRDVSLIEHRSTCSPSASAGPSRSGVFARTSTSITRRWSGGSPSSRTCRCAFAFRRSVHRASAP